MSSPACTQAARGSPKRPMPCNQYSAVKDMIGSSPLMMPIR